MKTIGSFEAKTHFSEIMQMVYEGQEVVITKRGKPMIKLVPYRDQESDIVETLKQIEKFAEKVSSRGKLLKSKESWKDLAHEHHKF